MMNAEALRLVFVRLKSADLISAAGTCSEWRKLALEEAMWTRADVLWQWELGLASLKGMQRRGTIHLDLRGAGFLMSSSAAARIIDTIAPQLRGLWIDYQNALDTRILRSLLSACPNLEILSLSRCAGVDDGVVALAARQCRQLKRLWLDRCVFSDVGLAVVGENLSELQTLAVRWNDQITVDGIGEVAGGCTKLRHLYLDGSAGVGNDAVFEISTHLSSLETLSLAHCSNVSNAGLAQICWHLQSLTALNLSYLPRISDSGGNVLESMKNLKRLNLSNTQIGNETVVVALIMNLTGLEYVDLSFTNVGDVSLDGLLSHMRNLKLLRVSGCGVGEKWRKRELEQVEF